MLDAAASNRIAAAEPVPLPDPHAEFRHESWLHIEQQVQLGLRTAEERKDWFLENQKWTKENRERIAQDTFLGQQGMAQFSQAPPFPLDPNFNQGPLGIDFLSPIVVRTDSLPTTSSTAPTPSLTVAGSDAEVTRLRAENAELQKKLARAPKRPETKAKQKTPDIRGQGIKRMK